MASAYLVTCWNCLGEFDALGAVWCSDDPKNLDYLLAFGAGKLASDVSGLVRTGVTTFEEFARLRL